MNTRRLETLEDRHDTTNGLSHSDVWELLVAVRRGHAVADAARALHKHTTIVLDQKVWWPLNGKLCDIEEALKLYYEGEA